MENETAKVSGVKVCANCGHDCGLGAYRTKGNREPLYFCNTCCAKEYQDLAFYERLKARGINIPLGKVRWSATEWAKWQADNLEQVDVINNKRS